MNELNIKLRTMIFYLKIEDNSYGIIYHFKGPIIMRYRKLDSNFNQNDTQKFKLINHNIYATILLRLVISTKSFTIDFHLISSSK